MDFIEKKYFLLYNMQKKKEGNMEKEIKIENDERIDDLEYKGLKIIQKNDGFCFGIDAVLLSDFAKDIKNGAKVIDLGTGTAILPILISAKTNASKIIGVEIQEEIAEMARRSVELNELQNKIEIVNENVKNLDKIFEAGTFDAIVTNPPYKKLETGLTNENKIKYISRHEVTANLEDFIKISSKLLKNNGNIYMVHRPERLADIMFLLKKYKLEPKVLKYVQSNVEKPPKLILIKATKNAKPFLKVEKPIYVYDLNGQYTEEILKIYNKIN